MKNEEYYHDLYKKIKAQLDAIPHLENRMSCSADDYFAYGNRYDILINGLGIVMNVLNNSVESQSIDNNCRSVLEALAVLNLANDSQGYLDTKRKELYRLSYATVERQNNDVLAKMMGEKFSQLLPGQQVAIFGQESTIACYTIKLREVFGDDDSLILKVLHDPTNYLKPSLSINYFNYRDCVEKYDKNNEGLGEIYHFFSTGIHPWCETDATYLSQIMNKREEYIDLILDKVNEYIDTNLEPLNYNDVQDFNEMFANIEGDNQQIMDNIIGICYSMGKALDEQAGIPAFIFQKMGLLIQDLYFYFCTNQLQLEISKYKSFVETSSALLYLFSLGTDKEKRDYKINGFIYSSRGRFINLKSQDLCSHNHAQLYNELSEVYNDHYKFEYTSDSFEKFLQKMLNNCFYPFAGTTRGRQGGIKGFVTHQITKFLNGNDDEKNIANDSLLIYDISLDLEHSCGFCFNTTRDILAIYGVTAFELAISLIEAILEKIFEENATNDYFGFFNEMINQCKNYFKNQLIKIASRRENEAFKEHAIGEQHFLP